MFTNRALTLKESEHPPQKILTPVDPVTTTLTSAYSPSPELKGFFCLVAASKDLQQKLMRTQEVSDAAQIARSLGFRVTDAEVMLAQANRILSMPTRDQEQTALGYQADYGAQWGRGGQGYLNATGYWLTVMDQWQQLPECQITWLLKSNSIFGARTVADVASLCGVDKRELLVFLAQQILSLNDEQLAVVASGKRNAMPL